MKWTTKAAIQRALAILPAGRHFYFVGQRCLGNFRRFTIDSKVRQGVSLLDCLLMLGEDVDGWKTVEIGTGWTAIIPLLFWAYGQKRCDTFDIAKLLNRGLVIKSIQQLCANPQLALSTHLAPDRQRRVCERLHALDATLRHGGSLDDILQRHGIRYHADTDAAGSHLPDASVDLVFSNVVLEHVPVTGLHKLFHEARRILRPGGYMVHLIDPSDHFSHSDSSVSAVNFLQFSEDEFARFNSPFLFQNRVRASEWREIIESHQFEIVQWRRSIDDQALRRLPTLRLDKSFRHFPPEDLCTTAIWVLAKRPAIA